MSTSEESERRLAEAMRAQATGVGRPGFVGRNPGSLSARPADPIGSPRAPGPQHTAEGAPGAGAPPRIGLWATLVSSRFPLLLALLAGMVLGVALALLSLLAPGVLPALG